MSLRRLSRHVHIARSAGDGSVGAARDARLPGVPGARPVGRRDRPRCEHRVLHHAGCERRPHGGRRRAVLQECEETAEGRHTGERNRERRHRTERRVGREDGSDGATSGR